MAVRGSALHKNHNTTLYIYSVISPYPFFIIVAYLEKYKRDLFPLNFVFVIIDVCLGHIFESTKGIKMELSSWIDGSERKGCAQEP